ncbi:response regulator [Chitinophaga sp. SYP-B3965]|uniref:LytR/AlgR family response regulator transcription factor n=1 Tax=Chitinophaga sp. SYP-B3965 TaxID=2663120 RepID=UPI001299EE92|nr:response regulator transcription factor [Chitinophaga sp. SYP-B3965]MRG48449.1 response regulator [Chitinophaga sp. SYP-B3965]
MNCIIIEDEPLAMLRMQEYISKVPFLTLLQSFDSGLAAISFLQKEKVDLVFLDIRMDELSGIQLLESLKERPAIILTTAFDEYALKAFELQVADYLLKPFTFERFLQAVIRVQETLNTGSTAPYLFIKTAYRLQKVLFEDILYIEGKRDYRKIHCNSDKIMTLETFGELEGRLPDTQFCRVHKSYIVALDKIISVEKGGIKIGEEIIPLSDTYKAHFYRMIRYPGAGGA